VFDKSSGGMREIKYRDMVILLRSMKVKADQFADQLRLAGIPVHSDSGTGFFESMEIRDVLSLLRLLDNQRQDVPMAAVLRSPLAKLPNADDCLATVRMKFADQTIPFHEAVVRYAETQHDEIAACLRDFLEQIARWREMIHRRPLAEVLWAIYDSTGYLAFCAGLEDGEQRVANLISLHERARQFGTFQRQGLNRFMQFIRNLQQQSDLGQPSVASEAEDVVRIMSVHRSKGLEFPVVFLPDLGKRHNLADCRGMILVDREAYLGLQAVDEEKRIRYPSLPWVLAQDRLKRQLLAEELRVLYVATTRAREHLILVGTGEEKAREQWEDWRHHAGALPSDFVLGCNSMLDWIGATTVPIEQNRPGSFEIMLHDDAQIQAWAGKMGRRPELARDRKSLAKLEELAPPPPADAAASRVIEKLTRPYAWEEFTKVSAVASVTGLTKTGRAAPGGESASVKGLVSFDVELAAPKCVAREQTATPTEVGSATHLVLQYLDFTRTKDAGEIAKQIEAMAMRKVISAEQGGIVDIEAIRWLMSSELGQLLKEHHSNIRRELPVYFAMPAAVRNVSGDSMDHVMVRGKLDVMIAMGDGLVVADYKTDRVTAETVEARVEFYRGQVESYADAIGKITGQRVTRTFLAFLSPRILKVV
jgi:ATP-dependent helicase/nuclease subunit A